MDLMNKFSKAINKASEKAGELTQQAKFKVDEQKLKNQISSKYKHLGEKIYFTKKENFSNEELMNAIDQHVEEIDLLMDALKQLSEEMAAIPEEKKPTVEEDIASLCCENCGADLVEGAAYCPSCGTKIE
ncbi:MULTISPECIES: zinc ribbon domain-containing protein [unclassified Fusibacter]|uniref:zinc ribbon domain-containing protein n=1 Tax=unclassified Fusibacter TaxID=2624464 RepID=UPI001012F9F0|nr:MULTISPECIES: zinc ribbon domain-containing protein [unclassified Fusibacter]MCK8061332.1 zinc ribbon domain-containing protein [Fusibacter sp. A2]NPE23471.1 zinc ribbon domain-containing protein [Fusibacter sp. A1]RXV59077.1 zinc ribbon domain-containing protein [Fusibacter sp. A1]